MRINVYFGFDILAIRAKYLTTTLFLLCNVVCIFVSETNSTSKRLYSCLKVNHVTGRTTWM